MDKLHERARAIRLAIFDVDGVLTDGRLYFMPDGTEFKSFNTLDGHGIKMLMASGVETATKARRWCKGDVTAGAGRKCVTATRRWSRRRGHRLKRSATPKVGIEAGSKSVGCRGRRCWTRRCAVR